MTNIAKIFFHLLNKHFPNSNRLYKILNWNQLKWAVVEWKM